MLVCPSGKRSFDERRFAVGFLASLKRRCPGYRGEVFRCGCCGAWHCGRTQRIIRQDLRRTKRKG